MPTVKIHCFSTKKLFWYGTVNEKEKVLELTREGTINSYANSDYNQKTIKKLESNTILFSQIYKAFSCTPEDISNILIILDFNDANKSVYDSLKRIKEVSLYVEDKKLTFVDFLKSSSMSANKKQIYYINKDYKQTLEERTLFGFNKREISDKFVIPKWYAASGLLLSSCTIYEDDNHQAFEELKIKPDEIMVIKDQEKFIRQDVITAISHELIEEMVSNICNLLNEVRTSNNDYVRRHNPKTILYLLSNIINISNSPTIDNIKDKSLLTFIKDIVDESQFYWEKYSAPILEPVINERFIAVPDSEDVKVLSHILDLLLSFFKKNITYDGSELIWHSLRVNNFFIKTNYYDGEGLISQEFAKTINEIRINKLKNDILNELKIQYPNITTEDAIFKKMYRDKYKIAHLFQFRLPFIKGVVHEVDMKQFFNDKLKNNMILEGQSFIDKTNIEYLEKHHISKDDNLRVQYDPSKIKIILTESQIKFLDKTKLTNRFMDSDLPPIQAYFKLLYEYDYSFAINNIDPDKEYYATTNREFWSTLPINCLDNNEVSNVFKNSYKCDENSINNILNSNKAINMIKKDKGHNHEDDLHIIDLDEEFYFKTQRGKNVIKEAYASKINDLLLSKISISGRRMFLASDMLGILYRSIGQSIPSSESLPVYQFYGPGIQRNTSDKLVGQCLLLRCPHYSRNEIAILDKRDGDTVRSKYFPNMRGAIMVNPEALVAERLAGADYDGDCVYVLDDINLRNAVINRLLINTNSNKKKIIYPLIYIPSLKTEKMAFEQDAKIDSWKIGFGSEIGKISNAAFTTAIATYNDKYLSKEYANKISKKKQNKISDPIYNNNNMSEQDNVALFTIISGLDIDSKKTGIKPFNSAKKKSTKLGEEIINNKAEPKKIKIDKISETDKISPLYEIFTHYKTYTKKMPQVQITNPSRYNYENLEESTNTDLIIQAIMKMTIYDIFINYNESLLETKKILNMLNEQIDYFCNNEMPIDVLKSNFIFDNPKEALSLYRDDKITPFHFLTKEQDKKNFILKFKFKNNKSPSNDAIKFVSTFKGESYKLLYYLIQEQIYRNYIKTINVEGVTNYLNKENALFIRKNFNDTCKKVLPTQITKSQYDDIFNDCINILIKNFYKISTVISASDIEENNDDKENSAELNSKIYNLRQSLRNLLDSLFPFVTMREVKKLTDITKSDKWFNVFYKETEEFLKGNLHG